MLRMLDIDLWQLACVLDSAVKSKHKAYPTLQVRSFRRARALHVLAECKH